MDDYQPVKKSEKLSWVLVVLGFFILVVIGLIILNNYWGYNPIIPGWLGVTFFFVTPIACILGFIICLIGKHKQARIISVLGTFLFPIGLIIMIFLFFRNITFP